MNILVFSIVLFLGTQGLALKCPVYQCVKEMEGPKGCAVKNLGPEGETVKLKSCGKETPYCEFPTNFEEEGTCKAELPKPFLFPGEFSEKAAHCLSGKLNGKVCDGKKRDEPCDGDHMCNPGLFCKDSKCAETVKINEKCGPNEKCDATALCYKGKCIRYLSLENGKDAEVPAICKSFYVNKENKCAEGPKLVKPEKGLACPQEGKCTYKIGEKTYTEPCVCGLTNLTKSYCKPGRGDISLNHFSKYLGGSKNVGTKCHIMRGPLCMTTSLKGMSWEFAKAFVAYAESTMKPLFLDNPSCVKSMITNIYWTAKDKVDNDDPGDQFGLYLFLGIAIGAILVIAILLLVIYFKRKKGEDDEPLESAGTTTQALY